MKRGTTTAVKKHERLNALLTLQISMIGAWLLVIFLTSLKRDLFLSLQQLIQVRSTNIGWGELALSFAIAIWIFVFLYKRHLLGMFASILLGFLGFTGAVIFLGAEISFFLVVSLILYERMHRSFLSNNLLILFAVVFGSIPIGISYGPYPLILVLFFFSAYDVAGVFLTRFIPHLARHSVEYGIPLLMIAPLARIKWSAPPNIAHTSSILGAGDLFLPAFFLSSVTLFVGTPVALAVLLGAVLGAVANTALAMFIKTGVPAMPLMTIGMIIGFFIT